MERMTAMAELVWKTERATGSRAKAVEQVNHWIQQLQERTPWTREEVARDILRKLDARRQARKLLDASISDNVAIDGGHTD